MPLFQVTNHVRGEIVHVFECATADQAMAALANLGGYDDRAVVEECSVTTAYAIETTDEHGPVTLMGDLPALQQALAEVGYTGPSIRVTSDNGETRGWVSADNWRAE